MKTIPLTVSFINSEPPVGTVTLSDKVSEMLTTGINFRLGVKVKKLGKKLELTELSLLPIPVKERF